MPSEVVSFTVTVPSASMMHISTFGGGPGNLDFVKFADQVPAKPPAGMPAAPTARETAKRENGNSSKLFFMADIIISIGNVSTVFPDMSGRVPLVPIPGVCSGRSDR